MRKTRLALGPNILQMSLSHYLVTWGHDCVLMLKQHHCVLPIFTLWQKLPSLPLMWTSPGLWKTPLFLSGLVDRNLYPHSDPPEVQKIRESEQVFSSSMYMIIWFSTFCSIKDTLRNHSFSRKFYTLWRRSWFLMCLRAYVVTCEELLHYLTLTKNDTLLSDFLKCHHYRTTSYFA